MKLFNKKTSNRGFTIIEMIVVIAVLAILVLLGAPRLLSYTQKAELTRIQHDTKVMENEMGVLMLENEVDIRDWENNNKDFNQLIAEDKLFEKEGVAEKVYARHLTRDGVLNLSKYFRELSSNKTASLSDDELGIGGESYPVNELPEDFSVDKTYKVIPEEYSDKIRTRLKGTFYVNSDGKVYYEHGKPIPGEDKDKSLTCPTALPDYEFEHVTGTIVKWHGTEQYLTIPSHFLVDGECWPVRIIGVGAFMRGNFRRVVIPDTVVRIEKDAFKDAIIDEIVIPHSVVNIADGAFSGGGINKVEVIGEPGRFAPGVFVDTEPTFRRPTPQDLNIVIHPESGTIVSSTRTFSPNRNNSNNSQSVESGNTGAVGGSLIIPEQVQVPGRTEPVRIENIHKGAFQGEGLIEVHMPYTLRRIEAYAFAGNQLNWVEIPESVEYIGEYAFAFNQHIHSSNNRVRPTIKSIKIKDIERINNVEAGNIVDNSGTLVSPLDGVEMKEYIWVTDANNFKFEEIGPEEPGIPVNPVNPDPEEPGNPDPEEPEEKEPVYSDEEIRDLIDNKGYIPIAIAEELAKIGQPGEPEYPLNGKYILIANINLSGYSKGEGWTPIGNDDSRFTGSFDGNGYKITGLTINRPTENYVGLFGYTQRATISNVSLEDINVTGRHNVGGLVGRAYEAWVGGNSFGTDISNSYATGSVTGESTVGGLVGYTGYGTISNSYATVSVKGTGVTGQIGGLAGYSYSRTTISNSYATGSVEGTKAVGGLVGLTNYSTTISNSHATGSVTGSEEHVGGLVGWAARSTINTSYASGSVTGTGEETGGLVGEAYDGTNINNSYATGSVTGTERVGGLVGFTSNSRITNSYATGLVKGSSRVGGLVGGAPGSYATNSYWDKESTGQSNSSGGNGSEKGKTTEEMKKKATYSGWNFDTVWKIEEGKGYPTLINNPERH